MKLTLVVDSPPFSINKAYYKASHTRTHECRTWGTRIQRQLSEAPYVSAIQQFKKAYRGEPLKVTLTFYHDLYKRGTKEISRKSMDLSNVEKLFIDLIFDERFDNLIVGNNAKFTYYSLCIDDKQIVELVSRKVQREGDVSQIRLEVEIVAPA